MVTNILKGFLTGVALVVPGLSGSVFAVALGIYEKILDSINNFGNDIKGRLQFLLPLCLGMAGGIVFSARAVLIACEKYPLWSYLFFAGMVLGALPLIFRKIGKSAYNPAFLLVSLMCFLAMLALAALGNSGGSHIAVKFLSGPKDAITMAWAGLFSLSLMTLPGVSGSVMLMIAGQYGSVYNALSAVADFCACILTGNWVMARESFFTVLLILPFGIGGILGILLMARIMGFLLKKQESLVYYGVLGVVSAAVLILLDIGVISNFNRLEIEPFSIILCVFCVAAGFLSAFTLSGKDY